MLSEVLSNLVSLNNTKIRKALLGYMVNETVCLPGNFTILGISPQVYETHIKVKYKKHSGSGIARSLLLPRVSLETQLTKISHPAITHDEDITINLGVSYGKTQAEKLEDILDSILGANEYDYEFLNSKTISIQPHKTNLQFYGKCKVNLTTSNSAAAKTLMARPSFLNLIATHNHSLQKLLIEPSMVLRSGDEKQLNLTRMSLDNATVVKGDDNKVVFRVDKVTQYSTLDLGLISEWKHFERTIRARKIYGHEICKVFGNGRAISIPRDYDMTVDSISTFLKKVYGFTIAPTEVASLTRLQGGNYVLEFDPSSEQFHGSIALVDSKDYLAINPLKYDLSTFIM